MAKRSRRVLTSTITAARWDTMSSLAQLILRKADDRPTAPSSRSTLLSAGFSLPKPVTFQRRARIARQAVGRPGKVRDLGLARAPKNETSACAEAGARPPGRSQSHTFIATSEHPPGHNCARSKRGAALRRDGAYPLDFVEDVDFPRRSGRQDRILLRSKRHRLPAAHDQTSPIYRGYINLHEFGPDAQHRHVPNINSAFSSMQTDLGCSCAKTF